MRKLLLSTLMLLFALPVLVAAPAEEFDVRGTIRTIDGTPIEGVVVSDGYTVVATAADGTYQFNRNKTAAYVFYSLPAEYEVPLRHGAPCFYKKLTDDRVYDFVLRPLRGGKEDKFRLVCIADPQCQNIRHVYRFRTETAPDLKRTAKRSKMPCYAVSLGDIVYSEGPRNANYLMPLMKEEMAAENIGMPLWQTIGNHDSDYEPVKIDERNPSLTIRLQRMFEASFGPLDYSWNRGDAHIVSMNDVVYFINKKGKKSYYGDFTDAQVEWLRKDLSFVPKDKLLILCVHIPVENGVKYENTKKVLAMLAEYPNCRIMSGHTHYQRNYTHKNGIKEHILAAASGCWWWSRNNGDGAPNGYGLFDIEGNQVTDYIYKGTGCDEKYQLRLYRGNAGLGGKYEQPTLPFGESVILANVWNYDEGWKVLLYEDGKLSGEMTKMKPSPFRGDENPSLKSSKDWWAIGYHLGVVGRGHVGTSTRRNYCTPCHHMFTYTLKNPKAAVKVVAIDTKGRKYTCDHVIEGAEYELAAPPVYKVSEVW